MTGFFFLDFCLTTWGISSERALITDFFSSRVSSPDTARSLAITMNDEQDTTVDGGQATTKEEGQATTKDEEQASGISQSPHYYCAHYDPSTQLCEIRHSVRFTQNSDWGEFMAIIERSRFEKLDLATIELLVTVDVTDLYLVVWKGLTQPFTSKALRQSSPDIRSIRQARNASRTCD